MAWNCNGISKKTQELTAFVKLYNIHVNPPSPKNSTQNSKLPHLPFRSSTAAKTSTKRGYCSTNPPWNYALSCQCLN
ncbi:unnamed protein product [Macrosiphum euphorbiae]|uniref:Uncharacterized protein n=1 Tax=Macrosiphum euphorbiae TaxID=13131 RepID=A0AAV0XCM8_9HEMI|nr:unnamed protein product [Macrosiphum euphorbiae]